MHQKLNKTVYYTVHPFISVRDAWPACTSCSMNIITNAQMSPVGGWRSIVYCQYSHNRGFVLLQLWDWPHYSQHQPTVSLLAQHAKSAQALQKQWGKRIFIFLVAAHAQNLNCPKLQNAEFWLKLIFLVKTLLCLSVWSQNDGRLWASKTTLIVVPKVNEHLNGWMQK